MPKSAQKPVDSLSNIPSRGSMWGILIALLTAWVLVLPESVTPFQGGKALVLVLGAGWALASPVLNIRFPRTPGQALPWMALLSITLSTLASPARHTSVWGNDYREMGGLVWAAVVVMVWTWAHTPARSLSLAFTFVVASGIAVGTLLWARLIPPAGTLASLALALQAGGTLGNAAFLSTALVPLVPYFFGLIRAPSTDTRLRRLFLGATVWCVLGLALVGSRAGVLGLGVAALGLGVLWLPRPWRWMWASVAGLLPTALLLWAVTHPHTWAWDFLYRNATLTQRLIVWQATLTLLARHPWQALVGFGPDTMALFFPEVYPPVLIGYEPDLMPHVFDRAHTLVLDVWVSFGVVGVLVVGAALVMWTRAWWRARSQPGRAYRDGAFVSTLALVSTWLVHFSLPPTLLMAGLLAVEASSPSLPEGHVRAGATLPRLWGIGLGLVAGFALLNGSGRALLIGLALVGLGLSFPFTPLDPALHALLLPTIGMGATLLLVNEIPGGMSLAILLFLVAAWTWNKPRAIAWSWWSVLAALVIVVPPLLSDAWLGVGQRALAREDVRGALTWGERAWRLLPRERTALFNAQAVLADAGRNVAERVEAALTWLDRAPPPHSANWWHVRLNVVRVGVEKRVLPQSALEQALEQARAYFPGNLLWR